MYQQEQQKFVLILKCSECHKFLHVVQEHNF
nr:MAG TPA: Ribosomal protein L44 [Caudoviricetes sp.]